MISMGSGPGCDAQYLFTCDILGETVRHRPRHAKVYRDFAAERERLQNERIAPSENFTATSRPAPSLRPLSWSRL